MATTKPAGRSNTAQGTKQIWVDKAIHAQIKAKADRDDRLIRPTVERALKLAIELDTMGIDSADQIRELLARNGSAQ